MSDIFHEVDEDLRRDKAEKLWKRYQAPIFIVAFLIVAATGAWSWYQTNRQKEAEAANARYEAASALAREGKHAEAAAAFDALAKSAPKGYASLARLRAALEIAPTDKAKAAAELTAMSEDLSVDKLTQDVARLRAVLLAIEGADREKVMTLIGPLMTSDGPFRYSAQEWSALDALEDDDFDEAERVFNILLNDRTAPKSMRDRAIAYRSLLHAKRGPGKTAGAAASGPVSVTPIVEGEDGPVDAKSTVKEEK